ncbi:MAG: chemotaxis protein CheW [Gemmatimonadales bacterium]|jgi:chemotaxis signal transduction protein
MRSDPAVRILLFRVGELLCGAPSAVVREILPRQTATRVPGALEAVRGIFNVRGQLLPLVDAGRALGRGPVDGGTTVLLEIADQLLGLAVDEVVDLIGVPADALADAGDLPGLDPGIVRAVGRYHEGAFVVLDVETLLAPMLST